MNCCLSAAASSGARSRASWSELPPGENGTTIFTGLLGHSCAPQALADKIASAPAQAAARGRVWSHRMLVVLVRLAQPACLPPPA
jgi:hypothetical protein